MKGQHTGVSEADNMEAGAEEDRQDVGNSQGVSSLGSGGKLFGNYLHHNNTGDGGTVGGVAADFLGLRQGCRLRGDRTQ